MKGIIYTRVSSDAQVAGTSLDDQENRCREYCENNGIEAMEVFREEGESAKSSDRTELKRAIAYCQGKKDIEVFVVHKLDRFARNATDHFAVRKVLKDSGVELKSTSEDIGDKPTQKFFEAVMAASAELDNNIYPTKIKISDEKLYRINFRKFLI